MTRRTTNRRPFTVSTNKNDNPTTYLFQQTEFTGLCDIKNDVQVDQKSFSSVKNMLIDRNGILVSRPPIRKTSGFDSNRIKSWTFGNKVFTMYKYFVDENGNKLKESTSQMEASDFNIRYEIYYNRPGIIPTDKATAEMLNHIQWTISRSITTWRDDPAVFATAIEDKVFFWISGEGFYNFNEVGVVVDGVRYSFFETGYKYLYVPVTETIANGVAVSTESENVLTPTYKERHLYSSAISYNQDTLSEQTVEVSVGSLSQESRFLESEYLYSLSLKDGSKYALLYPFTEIDNNAVYDVIETSTGIVLVRHNFVTGSVAYSFGGVIYTVLPYLSGIMGHPVLSKDGLYVFAFTEGSLYRAKIVSDGAEDDAYLNQWYAISYKDTLGHSFTLSPDFKPTGVFLTENIYAFVAKKLNGYTFYAQGYLDASETPKQFATGYFPLTTTSGGSSVSLLESDNISIALGNILEGSLGRPVALIVCDKIYNNLANKVLFVYHDEKTTYHAEQQSIDANDDWVRGDKTVSVVRSVEVSNGWFSQIFSFKTFGVTQSPEGRYDSIVTSSILLEWDADANQFDVNTKTSAINRVDSLLPFSAKGPFTPVLSQTGSLGVIRDYLVLDDKKNGSLPSLRKRLSGEVLKSGSTLSNNLQSPYVMYKVSANGQSVLSGPISSGDVVVCVENTFSPDDYDILFSNNTRYTITKTGGGIIRDGDSVTFTVVSNVTLPVGNHGNKTNASVAVTTTARSPEVITIYSAMYPIGATTEGLLFNVNDTLWSSIPSDTVLALDRTVNQNSGEPGFTNIVPTHGAFLSEYHFAISDPDAGYFIESSVTKRDEDRSFLLYLPKINEQRFAGEITGFHKISDEILGVFTEDAIWYIAKTTLSDGTVSYTIPLKTKLPFGCRFGDEILTMPDGQTVILPTERGIAALSPQNFVATTEPSVTYISDRLWQFYRGFYKNSVQSASVVTKSGHTITPSTVEPMIKIRCYGFYILFYKRYDRTFLIFDTRTSAWWVEEAPYPIRDILTEPRLSLILDISFNPLQYTSEDHTEVAALPKILPWFGCRFIWCDDEYEIIYSDDDFPKFEEDRVPYEDSVIYYNGKKAIRGDVVDSTLQYASPTILWYLTSQRLHLGAIDNYKAVRGLIVTAKGEKTPVLLNYKVFREKTHPEIYTSTSVSINDLRTFLWRVNALHAVNFQYQFRSTERDTEDTEILNQDEVNPVRLDAISVKYEIKEMIRV